MPTFNVPVKVNADDDEDVPVPEVEMLFITHDEDAANAPLPVVARVLAMVRIFVAALVRFPPVSMVALLTV